MSSGDLAYTAAAGAIGVGYMVVYLAIIVVSLVPCLITGRGGGVPYD